MSDIIAQAVEKVNMTEIQEKAIAKIQEAVKFKGQRQEWVSYKTKEALKLFCRQNEEFAEAVLQGGTMQECMDAAVNGVGNSPDDVEVYGKAVAFFFKGAKINLTMRIEMAGDPVKPAEAPKKEPVIIDISDLL